MSDNPVLDKDVATLPSGAQTVHLSAAATLTISQRLVFGTVNTANGSYTVTLPDVAEAAGLIFYVRADVANSKVLTLEDNGNDAGLTDLVLDTDNDSIILFSTGKEWRELNLGIV